MASFLEREFSPAVMANSFASADVRPVVILVLNLSASAYVPIV